MIDTVVRVYVTALTPLERAAYVGELAELFEYVTVTKGEGITHAWGREPTSIVEHHVECAERKWSVYDDLFPLLREYAGVCNQETVYVTVQRDDHFRGYTLDPNVPDCDGHWFKLAGHLTFNLRLGE